MRTVSFLIAHNHPIARRALRTLLEAQAGWQILVETGNGRDVLTQAQQIQPDIIILDLELPHINGIEAARLVLESQPTSKVLLLCDHLTERIIENALRVGVLGYLTTAEADKNLLAAVNALLEGRVFFTAKALHQLRRQLQLNRGENGHSSLTARETEIVQLLVEGKTNKEVAQALGLSVRTVENHRLQIMAKLGLESFPDLVRYAVRNGFVEP